MSDPDSRGVVSEPRVVTGRGVVGDAPLRRSATDELISTLRAQLAAAVAAKEEAEKRRDAYRSDLNDLLPAHDAAMFTLNVASARISALEAGLRKIENMFGDEAAGVMRAKARALLAEKPA